MLFQIHENRAVLEYTQTCLYQHLYQPKYLDQIKPIQTFIPPLPTEIQERIIDIFLAQLLNYREFDLIAEIIEGNVSLTKRFYRQYISTSNNNLNICSTRIFATLAICTAIERNFQHLVLYGSSLSGQVSYSLDLETTKTDGLYPWIFTEPPYFEHMDYFASPFSHVVFGKHYLDTIALIGKKDENFIRVSAVFYPVLVFTLMYEGGVSLKMLDTLEWKKFAKLLTVAYGPKTGIFIQVFYGNDFIEARLVQIKAQ